MDAVLTQLTAFLGNLPGGGVAAATAFAGTLGAWALLYLGVLVATAPKPARPRPASQDLPGDEPPAVVNLLVSGWAVTEDGAESTLLDLAARGYLELRQPDADPRHTTVHVTAEDPAAAAAVAARQARVRRAGGDGPLAPYERQVLDHVRRIAVGGVVPLTALTFREEGEASRWAATFSASVLADARRRGLLRRRIPASGVTLLSAAAVVPALAASRCVWLLQSDGHSFVLFSGIMVYSLLSGLGGRGQGWRGSDAGQEAASRWLGLRAYLEVDRAFAELPPSAVAVWDRYLAYGDALGVTHVSSAVLDLGMGNRDRVWSSYGGGWHQVRVRYPRAASRYGAQTGRLLSRGLTSALVGALPVYAYLAFSGRLPASWVPVQTPTVPLSWVAPVAGLGALLAARGLYRVVRALIDLATVRTVRGEVLWVAPWRSRGGDQGVGLSEVHYLAVDAGDGDRTTAWALPNGVTRGFGPGDVVAVGVRPWSRRVTRVSVLQSRHLQAPPAPAPCAPDGDAGVATAPGAGVGPGAPPVSPEELGERLRVPLGPPRPVPAGVGVSGAWLFPVASVPDAAVLLSVGSGRADHLLFGMHRAAEPVPGLGDEAYLATHGGVARVGDVVVRVAIPVEVPLPSGALIAALGSVLARLPRPAARTGW